MQALLSLIWLVALSGAQQVDTSNPEVLRPARVRQRSASPLPERHRPSLQNSLRRLEGTAYATGMSYRFVFLAARDLPVASDGIALSEVEFLDEHGSDVAMLTATNPGGVYLPREGPAHAIDGSIENKWLDLSVDHSNASASSTVLESVLELIAEAEPADVAGYRLFTAPDAPKRDPITWRLEARMHHDADDPANEYEPWHILHEVVGATPPDARKAAYTDFWLLAPPPPPPTPLLRLIITEVRGSLGADSASIDEIILYTRSGERAEIAAASNPGGDVPPRQGPERAVDQLAGSKWLDLAFPVAGRSELWLEMAGDPEVRVLKRAAG